jgi:hypothetical protein
MRPWRSSCVALRSGHDARFDAADPRELLPALMTLFDAVLEVRGERRVAGPYR